MAAIQILVVEDNEIQSKLVDFLLQEDGYTVQSANSAEQALEVLRSFSPNLILMDLQLPGIDGLQLVRQLRLDPVHVATPIIALTAYTEPSDIERAREAGCNGSIFKPIDPAAFARQVGSYMGRAGMGGAPGVDPDFPSDSTDLLAEMRNNFLAEGLTQCSAILEELKRNPGSAIDMLQRVIHRWARIGETEGFPLISHQARLVETLLKPIEVDTRVDTRVDTQVDTREIVSAVETASRRFGAAAHSEPKLAIELITGLRDMRIGLVNFSAGEASRVLRAAKSANIDVVIEQMSTETVDNLTTLNALCINVCSLSAEASLLRPHWPIPAVFIGSRSSLEALSMLPSRSYDFLIAPWDAEEVLMRLYRLVGKAAPLHPPAHLSRPRKRRARVLIVDDDPDIVSLVSEALNWSDMDCDIARSGKQALESVQRHLPDAILLDVNMLDIDGFEVLKRLRRNLVTAEIPVLMLTARNQQSDLTLGLGSGANDYVVKPFKPLDLVKRVDQLIRSRRKEGPPAPVPAP